MISASPETFYGNREGAAHTPKTTAGQPAEAQETNLFLTANGSTDSHAVTLANGKRNRSPRAGQPYRGISWGDISGLIDAPTAVEKNDAPFVILSDYRQADGRTHAVQRERGSFGGLAVDIDKGNPTLAEVVAAVSAVTGGARAEVYSSSSASDDSRKWRVLIPLASPVTGADYADTQEALFGLLKTHGLECDFTLARAAQPVYLPNVPPARRGKDGRPAFYQSHHAEGPLLDLTEGTAIVEARATLRARREARQAQAAARAAEAAAKRQARIQATGDDFDPIAHFKDAHTIAACFAAYGFKQKTGTDDYKSPFSGSSRYATRDMGDHWVCLSSWATDHNIGFESKKGYRYGDAFDLFVAFEHHGDRRAAVLAYLAELGRLDDSLDERVPVVVEPIQDRGEARTLGEWREEMRVERALALRQPGIHFDGSQTGSGKTTATVEGIQQAMITTKREAETLGEEVTPLQRVLIALPDHANIRERVEEMKVMGVDAVAYPDRSAETCRNLEAVDRAQSLGLTAGAAVCWACPLKESCKTTPGQYLHEVKRAQESDWTLCTHERLRLAPSAVTKERDAIVIDEQPGAVLAPSISVRVDDMMPVVTLARTVRDECLFRRGRVVEPAPEERAFAAAIVAAYETIVEAAGKATAAGVSPVDLPAPSAVPDHWQTTLLRWADDIGISVDLNDKRKRERFQKSLRLLTMIVTGGLDSLHLLVDQTSRHERQPDGTVKESQPLHHFVYGAWKTRLPKVPVLCLDATTDPQDLRDATGQEVTDRTPAGHLPNLSTVTQVPMDITASQSPAATAAVIEDHLHRHPHVQRLGVMGHQRHIRAIMADDSLLSPRLRSRIGKTCYFGQGPDRASNDWHSECDDLIVVGTMRPGGGAVRERLVRHGKHESAQQDGDWGPRHWQAVTVDGRAITVEGKGYRHPEWHHAHAAISRAAGQQCGGRGRSITDKGIPVTYYTDEPMGVPVDDSVAPVARIVRETVEAVVRCRDWREGESSLFSIRDTYRKKSGSGVAVRVQAVVDLMIAEAAAAGERLGRSGAEKRLRLARKHGRLESPEKGWLLVVGDSIPAPVEVPAEAVQPAPPKPALLAPTAPAVVISATGPAIPSPAVEVLAEVTPETTTCISTDIVPATLPLTGDDLSELIDERAAIMEHDGGLGREVADRLAAEMIMGRGASAPLAPPEAVGVDHPGLMARMHPLVDQAVQRFGGTVRLLHEDEDPFRTGWGQPVRKPAPGCCTCGSSGWVDVPIHGGASTRRDCHQCGRFREFSVWYGKPLVPSPVDVQPTGPGAVPKTNRLSFLAPMPAVPDLLHAG
jgi:hypothetical protein